KRLANSHLSPQNYIILNFCCTCNTNLASKQTILTNFCIMTYMYKVVDLGSCTNHRIATYTTINCAISADLNKIFKYNSATTIQFFIMNIPVDFFIIIKCITTNNGACLYNNIVSYHTMIQNANIRLNNAI